MLQVRKLVLAVAAATAFSSGLANALGLGDLAVKSSLNQPLEAEISLLEVRDLTSLEIKSQLASPEEFSRAGVDRQFFLTGLKFTPVINANGKSVIRVTSAKPVKEPYLNFLVEILWPNGRLLREYTVLLDPPLYTPQQIIYAPQPAVISSSSRPVASVQQPVRSQQAKPTATATSSQPVARPSSALQGSEYRVQKNDTLWEIAARVGGNAAVHQTMLAIQDLNPNAFLDGNINRMKNGQVLRLPTEQDINSRNRADAIAQVAQQNTNWKSNRVAQAGAERQLDATRRNEAGATPVAVEKADNLRLVADAPGQAQQAADQGNAANTQAVQDQLAVTKERLDSTTLENQDLKGRVEDLNSQLEKLQRLIELKDNQLAQLQNAVDAPVDTLEVPVTAVEQIEPVIEEVSPANETPAVIADDVASEPADAEAVVDVQTDSAEAEVVAVEPEPVVEPEPIVEAEPVAEPAPVVEPKAEASLPVAEVVEEEQGLFDKVMDDPMMLAAAGGGAVLALLLLLMAISRRNARKEAEFYDEQLNETQLNNDVSVAVTEDSTDTDFLSDIDLEKTEENTDSPFADDFNFDSAPTETGFKQPVTDPIAEADSYISFGRFNQAADVLTKAVDQEPQRIDLRLKLVEVYADLEDRDGFSRQVQEITDIGGATAQLAQIKARYPQMFDAEQVESVAVSNAFDDFDLNDLTLELPAENSDKEFDITSELDDLSALLAETEADVKTADDEFSLDLPLDSAPVQQAVETTEFAGLDDFNFDLGAPAADEKPANVVDDDFSGLSLSDLELDLPSSPSEQTSSFELDDDFGFASTESDNQIDSDFGAQLDEVNAELDNLTSSLSDDVLELNISTDVPASAAVTEKVDTTETFNSSDLGFDDLQDLDGLDDDFGMLAGTDETATKLDLARAYVDMGDAEGARDILDEVIAEGTASQQDQARELIAQLG